MAGVAGAAPVVGPVARDILEVRRTLIQYLAIPFGGDELVAEYTLLHLISAVRGRVDLRPIGRFLLNVTGCPRSSNVDGTASSALGTFLRGWRHRTHPCPH